MTISEWRRLSKVAKDEGKLLEIFGNWGEKSWKDCQEKCDKTNGCHSFGYCPGENRCYLFDKCITKNEPIRTNFACFTSYKSCQGNNPLF